MSKITYDKNSIDRFDDLTGKVFHRLTVIEFAGKDKSRKAIFRCQCSCGNITLVRAANLKTGNTKSCGCLRKELQEKWPNGNNIKHGLLQNGNKYSSLYNIYWRMIHIAKDLNITVCEEWIESSTGLPNFIEWAIGSGYHSDTHLIRKDLTKGFDPDNCEWGRRNLPSNSVLLGLEIEEVRYVFALHIWSKITGIPYTTLNGRLTYTNRKTGKRKLSIKELLTTPVRKRNALPTFNVSPYLNENHPELWDNCIHD